MSEFIRVLGNFSIWTIGLIFWGMTFIPINAMHVVFSYVATGLLWANMIRLGGILIIKCIAFIGDNYINEYKYYPYKIEWGGSGASQSIDFSLELSTFIGQMIAYPLLQHSIKKLAAYKDGELKGQKESTIPTPKPKANGDDSVFAADTFGSF
jgi:hypothetical protein